jgi:phenylpyruvate tautomerase PptA (4-oxalocrotonate tautomerase family)
MPMIDALIPAGALSAEAEARLVKEVTDILITAEGYDPKTNQIAQSVSVCFVHRPAAAFVGGEIVALPRYRFIPSVPEGQYTDEARNRLVKEITEAVARAEGTPFEDAAPRVMIFPTEIPEGTWGGRGLIRTLADIHAMLLNDPSQRIVGERRVAKRRREKISIALANLLDTTHGEAPRT